MAFICGVEELVSGHYLANDTRNIHMCVSVVVDQLGEEQLKTLLERVNERTAKTTTVKVRQECSCSF